MKKVFVIFAVLTAMLLMVGCQNKSQAKKESSEPIKIGDLTWSSMAEKKMNLNDGLAYCKNLNEGGYTDWRLPNIDELRTLIKNHPGTQSGGSCLISEKAGKLASGDWTIDDCGSRDGSNFSKLGDTGWFLSSSQQADYSDVAWAVNFDLGLVHSGYDKDTTSYVRCVRGSQNEVSPQNLTWSSKADKDMNWDDAVAYCKNLNEGGYSDWHLPTISELRTLIQNCPKTENGGECGVTDSCLSGKCRNDACSGCGADSTSKHSKLGDTEWFWSFYVQADNSVNAWRVSFYYGNVSSYNKNTTYSVRCVRGSQNEASLQNPTVASSRSETSAKKEPAGPTKIGDLTWSSKADKWMNWHDAVAYCKNLNEGRHNDWRLPNIDELRTLIQNHPGTQSGGSCQISEKAGKLAGGDWTNDCISRDGRNFSKLGDTGCWFWSSSVRSDNSDNAWQVDFGNGGVYDIDKSGGYDVRCVR